MPLLPEIVVTSYREAEDILRRPNTGGFHNVISINEPGTPPPRGFHTAPARKILLEFDDVCTESAEKIGRRRPTLAQAQELITFLREARGKTLFQCAAGVSRSAAAAFVYMAMLLPEGEEVEAMRLIKTIRPQADPNRLLLFYADRLLGREGRLVKAAQAVCPKVCDIFSENYAALRALGW